MKSIYFILLLLVIASCKKEDNPEASTEIDTSESEYPFELTPIQHASFVLDWGKEAVYVDPSAEKFKFKNLPDPTLVLLTDIHGDHLNLETLKSLPQTYHIVAPIAVYKKLPEEYQNKTKILPNGKTLEFHGFEIEAIAMYNTTEERKKFHEKGRGNGYVVSKDNYRVYISGDTEGVPEMKKLKKIDLAFICMNLPYTMLPEAAAEATLAFKPNEVIPYHYRGKKDGETHYYDTKKFKRIINKNNPEIKVRLLDWYPAN